ncbi:hypothetical protein ALON55S_05957 [Alishewanella longhuensis]
MRLPKLSGYMRLWGLLGQVQRRGCIVTHSAVQLAQIKLIRQAQQLGFRLPELGAMLPDAGQQPDWSLLLQHLEDKQLDIRRQLSRLTSSTSN